LNGEISKLEYVQPKRVITIFTSDTLLCKEITQYNRAISFRKPGVQVGVFRYIN